MRSREKKSRITHDSSYSWRLYSLISNGLDTHTSQVRETRSAAFGSAAKDQTQPGLPKD